MKTLFTHLQKVATTPPTYLLVLFAWLLLPLNVSADVTAEWGESFGGASFPSESSSLVNNVTLSTTMPVYYNAWLGGISNAYHYNIGTGSSIDIKASDGYKIKQLKTSVWYSTDVRLTIHFSASSPYDGNILQSVDITGHEQGDANLYDVEVPNGAKSARIVSTGTSGYGAYFYRLQVTIEETDPCAAPVTASFVKEGSETGSVPSTINSCEGSSITIQGQGSLVKTGYDFVGWSYNSTTYAPGTSFTMPATNVNFTAVWEQHVVPAVTNLKGNVSNDDIILTWENYNEIKVSEYSYKDDNMSCNISDGILTGSYNLAGGWAYGCIEITLPRKMVNVTSVEIQYNHNNTSISEGGLIPYLKSADDGNGAKWYSDIPEGEDYLPNVADYTAFSVRPEVKLWGNGNDFSPSYRVSTLGIIAMTSNASSGTFSIKDIHINTSDGQTLLDEVIVVRKEGSAPTSMNDGTQVYSGLLNTYTDNNLPEGSYYYAVYVRDGDAYSNAVVTGPVVIASPKADANLVLNTNATTIPVGGLFTLTHTTADGYDGSISYSVAPEGVIDFNESTGVITALQTGTATITVTASETTNFVGDTKTCTVTVTKNFVGDLTIEGTAGDITLNWFYNLPISLETEVTTINQGGSYTSSNYVNGVRTIVYNCNGGTAFYARDFKTPDSDHQTPNCKSFSVKLRGDEDNVNNLRIVPYSWVYRPNYDPGDLVADPIVIEDDWKEVVITPSYYYIPGNENIKGDAPEYNYSDFPVGCVAFFPMSTNAVNNKQLQLKEAYFQLINTNGLTTSVALVRKKGSAPEHATDGDVIYDGSSTTLYDDAVLDAGSTYYYRVFATKGGYTYVSNVVSIDVPAPSLTYYERTVTPGEYGTVCIGYAVEHENISGAEIYEIDSWSADGKALTLSELGDSESMFAGRPYIFYANASTLSLGYDGSAAEAPAGSHNGLIGSYSQEQITANDDNYIIYQNKLYMVTGTNYVGANRAYIHKQPTNPSSAPRRRVTMGLYGTQTATGIDDLQGNDVQCIKFMENGVLYILRDGVRYNVMGTKIQ